MVELVAKLNVKLHSQHSCRQIDALILFWGPRELKLMKAQVARFQEEKEQLQVTLDQRDKELRGHYLKVRWSSSIARKGSLFCPQVGSHSSSSLANPAGQIAQANPERSCPRRAQAQRGKWLVAAVHNVAGSSQVTKVRLPSLHPAISSESLMPANPH